MSKRLFVITLALTLLSAGLAAAADPIVYPAKGQSSQQMEQDKYQCYTWAKQQTGYDPMQGPPQTSQGPTGEVVRGAAGGALVGLGIGAIAGDAGKGAAIGAGSGAVIGGIKKKKNKDAASAAVVDQYNRAYGVCLEGRGYSVK